MLKTIIRIAWLQLMRDRIAQGLTFALPIAFFSIFAVVFGGMGGGGTSAVHVAVVDEDHSEASRRLMEGLVAEKSLYVHRQISREDQTPLTRESAIQRVRDGKVPVAVIIKKGFGENFGMFFGNTTAGVELHADKSNPIAPQMVGGLLQKAAMTSAPDLMLDRGMKMLEQFGGPMTDPQRKAMDAVIPMLRPAAAPQDKPGADADAAQPATAADDAAFAGLVSVEVFDVLGEDKSSGVIAFYAAGTAVLFLLFSMAGAGGTILEEEEQGVLERLLSSHISMTRLLLGKWVFLLGMGFIQVTVMFIWGWLLFGVELWTPLHLLGFAVMTLVTAAAAAAFGLVLATACRTRAQLGGASTIIILIMSAVGGSMFPRFLMPPVMQDIGLITFNAWALDGYQKVFWYDKPVWELWPQVGVLVGLAIVFMLAARLLARRWEAV
jgi:ABC-2 type transport system permease protein